MQSETLPDLLSLPSFLFRLLAHFTTRISTLWEEGGDPFRQFSV